MRKNGGQKEKVADVNELIRLREEKKRYLQKKSNKFLICKLTSRAADRQRTLPEAVSI